MSDSHEFNPDGASEPVLWRGTRAFGWSNMFVAQAEDPRTDGGYVGERPTLLGFLDDQRLTLRMKCDGLGPEDLARRSVPPSNLSLLGLVRHMAGVEQNWFRIRLAGQDVPRLFRSGGNRDEDFDGAVADADVVADAWRTWRAEVAFADEFVAGQSDLGFVGAAGDPLREVLVHMIEEYARHNGHADFLRERIDGRVGQ